MLLSHPGQRPAMQQWTRQLRQRLPRARRPASGTEPGLHRCLRPQLPHEVQHRHPPRQLQVLQDRRRRLRALESPFQARMQAEGPVLQVLRQRAAPGRPAARPGEGAAEDAHGRVPVKLAPPQEHEPWQVIQPQGTSGRIKGRADGRALGERRGRVCGPGGPANQAPLLERLQRRGWADVHAPARGSRRGRGVEREEVEAARAAAEHGDGLLQCFDGRVDLLLGVVEVRRQPRAGGDAELLVQRLRAVVPRPHGDAPVLVHECCQIVCMAALHIEGHERRAVRCHGRWWTVEDNTWQLRNPAPEVLCEHVLLL
mmetsp:Transcript_67453/g.197259  ORF Transcript_67453/g.197259 Transcript_67453/m.197259 type:complete len:313 (+) Transcript_67453:434-1372(+)